MQKNTFKMMICRDFTLTVLLPQASHYRDITFRIDAGMDGAVSVTLTGSIVLTLLSDSKDRLLQFHLLPFSSQFTNVYRASGCENMVWGSICHALPTLLLLPPQTERIMLSWTQTVHCQPVPVICGGLLVMLIPSLSLTFTHPLSNTWALFQNLVSRLLSTSF